MYTINGKEYTEYDIDVRCAEIMGEFDLINESIRSRNAVSNRLGVGKTLCLSDIYNPCQNPSDTWPVIEKVFDRLNKFANCAESRWQYIMNKHNCSKLVAACICLIEMSEGE